MTEKPTKPIVADDIDPDDGVDVAMLIDGAPPLLGCPQRPLNVLSLEEPEPSE